MAHLGNLVQQIEQTGLTKINFKKLKNRL
jgi:hypothetical protein